MTVTALCVPSSLDSVRREPIAAFFAAGFEAGRRWRANMAHVRRSRPDYGLGYQVQVCKAFEFVSPALGEEVCSRVSSWGVMFRRDVTKLHFGEKNIS